MANTRLFQSASAQSRLPAAMAVNVEGAPAYALAPRHRLAQYAATGCLNATYYASDAVPAVVRQALEQALEQVPQIAGRVVVCPDVSGSMSSPVSGYRGSATSSVRCIDVAALIAAAMLRRNREATGQVTVLPFEQGVVACKLDADASVMDNAARLAAIGGGGTNCSAPLARLNSKKALADLVIYVSDNESWIDATRSGATATMMQWQLFKQRNPQARLVCIDIAPHATTQAGERDDILNIGGFSDDVFRLIAMFAAGQLQPTHWVGEIEAIEL